MVVFLVLWGHLELFSALSHMSEALAPRSEGFLLIEPAAVFVIAVTSVPLLKA